MNSRLSSASMSAGHVPAADRLPLSGLLALALTGFIAMLTEVLPAGLLPQIGRGLAVSDALAGQLMTLYALGALLTAIPLTTATRGMRRRPLLLLAITGFLVFNTITVLSSSYTLTLTARFFAGMAAGLTWSLIGGYARRMVAVPLQGRALSVAMIGIPLALSIGVPLGTWSGALAGWRTPFAIISGLALILVVWVLTKVPDFPGQATHQRMPLRQVFAMPGMRSVLFVVLAWMLAHNIFGSLCVSGS
jgi:predicted MFS family arabinose efflux permease